ncbi:putative c2h2 finger domain-containing protein [Erysiphe neolycopersici]|uniref:Putative c2h2 finger domain-containing protein n=1 Tax=Erysiphe neolycopersici TaxID=212602 RepID=A0A420HMX8_9PEZI|nr:putative c2h2 finger domain-containing protein [Erysiphe neolycopersici]
MLPQTSKKDIFDHLIFEFPTKENTSDETHSPSESFQSCCFPVDENVEISSFNKPEYLKKTLHDQLKPSRYRKRAQAFIQTPSKARQTNSNRQTRLCIELPSKYEIRKSSSRLEPQKSCIINVSSSKISNSSTGHNFSKKKTPQKEVNNGRTMRNRTSQFRLNQTNFEEKKRLGKSYSNDIKDIELSVHSQKEKITVDNSTASHICSKAEVNLSISKSCNLENNHKLSHRFLSSSLDSEDPLTGSIPVDYFHFKPQKLSHILATSPKFSSTTQSISKFKQNSPCLSAIDSCTNKDPASSKSHQQEKSNPVIIDLVSSLDTEKLSETTEIISTVHLRSEKNETKPPVIKKSRKQNGKIHQEVSVPDPIYHPFKCEWEGCRAELMNMEILRKHVYTVHGKKLEDGGRRCLWGGCGLVRKETCSEELTTASRNANGLIIASITIYLRKTDWKEHMEKIHLIPFSWHMGDGPCGSRLAKPSTVWQQPYLFLSDGRQVTPSVASQPIEKGAVRKLNANRFRWQQGGPFGSKILVPISQL